MQIYVMRTKISNFWKTTILKLYIFTSLITGLIDTAEKWGKAKSDVIANGRLNWIAEKRKLHESEFDIIGSPIRNTGPKRKYDEMEFDHMEYDDELDEIMVGFYLKS